MVKTVLAALLLAAPAAAGPDRASILLGSHHAGAVSDYEEVNPGLFLSWDNGVSVGAFRNSYDDLSLAVTYGYDLVEWERGALTLFGGLATYPDHGIIGDNLQPVGGLQLRHGHLFGQVMPSDGKAVDYILAFGLTFELEH